MSSQRNDQGKRSHSRSDYGENGRSKRRNPSDEREAYTPAPEDTLYRYLCPGRKIGSIIGRGGEIVKQLRADTQAKIRIGETVPGCDERVISIFSSSNKTCSIEDFGETVCAAQDALFKVHERVISDEVASEEESNDSTSQLTVRILVPSDQIGCIIGKGGQIIQGLRSDTGAQIRIFKNEFLPSCAISTDELLQISGEPTIVKKALFQVSSRLRENPSRLNHMIFSSVNTIRYGGMIMGSPGMGVGTLIDQYRSYRGHTREDWSSFYHPRDGDSAKEFSIRLICPSASIGSVIGKGGFIINQIRQDSGAHIKVDSSNAEDDCIITISAKEHFEDPVSATVDAAVRLQPRCSEKTERESRELTYTTRLLVSTAQIGCLIGKGGSIISEMRRITCANIRVLSKDNLPKCASEDDEMVQIIGDLNVASCALVQILMRLKANFFEREGAPFQTSYHPTPSDSKPPPGRDFSYSAPYGLSADLLPPESFGSSQVIFYTLLSAMVLERMMAILVELEPKRYLVQIQFPMENIMAIRVYPS